MYLVKLKYKKSIQPCYSNLYIVHPVEEVRKPNSDHKLQHFFLSLKQAKDLMFYHICKNNVPDEDGWFDEYQKLEYISVVELSNYEPYREYEVVEYKEF